MRIIILFITKFARRYTPIVVISSLEAEANSNHPIAKSIRGAYDRPIDESTISNYTEIAAHGIQATIEGKLVLAGNNRLLHRENIAHDTCDVEGTVVHLAVDHVYARYIVIADEIKEDAIQAIRDLRAAGVFLNLPLDRRHITLVLPVLIVTAAGLDLPKH